MSTKINSIVIVGGGSAGWMSAASLIKAFPNKKITVIESSDIPKVGVGESTVQEITTWLNFLDIDHKDFMKHTNAAYKLGIGFTNFKTAKSPTFFYTFGNPDISNTYFGLNDWLFQKALDPQIADTEYAEYFYPQANSFKTNKLVMDYHETMSHSYRVDRDVVYQFDASLFGSWLANNYAIPKGVTRIINTVKKIEGSKEGITALILENGIKIEADLFIDCSGFKSLLLGEFMEVPFISTKEVLPNNKAWYGPVQYTNKEKEMQTFTNCTAVNNGWIWNTPLWSRIGTGYVYSDEFVDDDTALQEFKDYLDSNSMVIPDSNRSKNMEFKQVQIKNGYYERSWEKNVVAIGLSAGFLEPLESTGLLFIHDFLSQLIHTLQRREFITAFDITSFNKNFVYYMKNTTQFVSLHFQLSQRADTPYWDKITNNVSYPDEYFNITKDVFTDRVIHNPVHTAIAVGLGYNPCTSLLVSNLDFEFQRNTKELLEPYIKHRKLKQKEWKKIIDKAPTHYQYLKENIYNENQ
jgi:tryptophan halogenase